MNNNAKADSLIQAFAWCENRSWVKAVALVGSYARGHFRDDSDVDFVIIVDDKAMALHAFEETPDLTDVWAQEPVDAGTEGVVRNGFASVLDKCGIFRTIETLLAHES